MMQLTTSMSRADGRAGAAVVTQLMNSKWGPRHGPFQRNNQWQRAAILSVIESTDNIHIDKLTAKPLVSAIGL